MTDEILIIQPPPKRPNRDWEPTRLCGCGECRVYPPDRRCPQPEKAIQLYRTKDRMIR